MTPDSVFLIRTTPSLETTLATSTRDLNIKPIKTPLAPLSTGRRVFPDGYDLDKEALAVHSLANSEEIDVNDPLYPQYQEYTERLQQWALLQDQHRERAGAESSVPVAEARKVAQMSPLQSDGEDSMTLHTLEAMRLFLGAAPIPGELKFGVPGGRRAATALRQLFLLSAQDNPYADMALCDVDKRIAKITAQIAVIERQHHGLLERARTKGLNYSVIGARTPQSVSLGYHSPYGYAISNLIVEFDYLVRVVKSTERRDLSSKKDVHAQLLTIKREYRSLFEATLHAVRILLSPHMRELSRVDWLPTVNEDGRKRREAASKLLGTVPQEVFTGELSPRHTLRNERLSGADRKMLQQIAATLNNLQETQDASAQLPGDANELVQ